MALALLSPTPPRPRAEFKVGRSTIRFYLGDCLTVLPTLDAESIGSVVTSPPYNIGVKYRSYQDDLPRTEYLNWTDRWMRAVARVVTPDSSFFLNVGAKPTDPWVPLEVAQVARRYFKLQNTIHWVKSIAIDREAAGQNAGFDRDVAVGHYKPINSERFVNDCHEFIFHFTPGGRTVSTGAPWECPTRTRPTSNGGRPLVKACAAAAIHGSSPTRPFRAVTATVRTRRRSHLGFPISAYDYTASTGLASSSTRSWAWAPRRSRPRGWDWISWGSRWTSTTCGKPSIGSRPRSRPDPIACQHVQRRGGRGMVYSDR